MLVDEHTIEVSFTKPDVLFPIYELYVTDNGIVAELGANWMGATVFEARPRRCRHGSTSRGRFYRHVQLPFFGPPLWLQV